MILSLQQSVLLSQLSEEVLSRVRRNEAEISPIPLILFSPIHSSIELNEEGGGAVPPLGVVRHLRAAHRARPLAVEPRYLKEGRFNLR